ncbi:MAG: SDR family NAD(P)-dependent oxidoreductase [Proteobacteria bacterium]|nr:SDR family NAD(P)-dependent oxidoreductase [Pseudomonadota bacterium]
MKKVIIIGASSGIGEALARVFAKNGYIIGLTARRIELLKNIQAELKTKSYVKYMDLLKPDDAIRALEELIREMDGVDIVIINSGTGHEGKILEFEKERIAIDVNVLGFTAMAAPAYGASKAYLSFYLEGLRHKFAQQKQNIYITDIKPGYVYTPLTQNHEKMIWVSTAQKAASQIYDAIIGKKKHAYITKRWILLAWLLKIIPDFIYNRF